MQNHVIATDSVNSPPTHLHVASLIAHVRPEQMPQLKEWITSSPHQIEIHAENPQGKLVLVTESDCEQAIVQILDELRAQAGVLNAALVYHEQIALEELEAEEQDV